MTNLRAVSGVQGAALTSHLPTDRIEDRWRLAFEVEVYPSVMDQPEVKRALITPGFFDVFGVRILEGRDFQLFDERGASGAAIVNTAFVERFFEGGSAVGHRLLEGTPGEGDYWRTIVGVVPDLDMAGFRSPGTPADDPSGYYVPVAQADGRSWALVLRPSAGDPMSITPDVRKAVQVVDLHVPVFEVRSIGEVIYLNSWFFQVFGVIFVIFGAAAMLMASFGL